VGVFSALRSSSFRLLWLGQSASIFGDGLIVVAVGLFVTGLTGNPSDVGLVLASYSIPLVLLVLVGGVVADRLPRKTVMITSDCVRCLLHSTLALLIATGTVRIRHMVIIGVLFGSFQAFFQPAYSGLVPQTVSEEDIQSAQALAGVTRELASFVSPALATVLVLSVGGAVAFSLDAATFAISALTLAGVRPRERGPAPERSGIAAELLQGWAAVRERTWVWATITAFSIALLVALTPFEVLGPSVARQAFGTEAVYGFTTALWGAGMVLGALLGARWKPRRPLFLGLNACLPCPVMILLFATSPPTAVLAPVTFVSGAGIGLFGVWWETALVQRIPPHLLSRVCAWDWMGSLALAPLGYLAAGPIAAVFGGVRVLITGGAIGTVAIALSLLPASTRHLTRVEDDVADPPGTSGEPLLVADGDTPHPSTPHP
jgi:MFS family permease